jgi:ferredoxin
VLPASQATGKHRKPRDRRSGVSRFASSQPRWALTDHTAARGSSTRASPTGDFHEGKCRLCEVRRARICESLAPGIFEVDDDGNLNLLKDDICSTDLHDVEEAVATCPTGALRISS